jgi:hypothetical protein
MDDYIGSPHVALGFIFDLVQYGRRAPTRVADSQSYE